MKLLITFLLLALPAYGGAGIGMGASVWDGLNYTGLQMKLTSLWITGIPNAVSGILDLSGHPNRSGTQPSLGARPLLISGELNGHPAICCDGTNHVMPVNSSVTMATLVGSSGTNCAAVFVIKTTNTFPNGIFQFGSAAASTYEMLVRFTDGNGYFDFGNNGTARLSGAVVNTNYVIWVVNRSNANAQVYTNGVSVLTTTGLSGGATSTAVTGILFDGLAGGQKMRGGLVEISFYNTNFLNLQAITNITRLIATRYNISVP